MWLEGVWYNYYLIVTPFLYCTIITLILYCTIITIYNIQTIWCIYVVLHTQYLQSRPIRIYYTCWVICSGVMTTPTPQLRSKVAISTGSTGWDFRKSRAADIRKQKHNQTSINFWINHSYTYRIAGNIRWYKFSYIWPKNPQNNFLFRIIKLQDYIHAAHLWPMAQHYDLAQVYEPF